MGVDRHGFDADKAWEFIKKTAEEITAVHPGQTALYWAEGHRPELLQEIACSRDGLRDAVHSMANEKVEAAAEGWKAAYLKLSEAYVEHIGRG